MEQLYILQLENGKYYVGKSNDVQKRFREHKSGSGSAWTSEYKPIKILETRPITSSHDETNVTKDLMKKHGIDNVRGGAYCQVELPEHIEETIRHEIRSSNDSCYKCGKRGHFASKCDVEVVEILVCTDCKKEFNSDREFDKHYCRPVKTQPQQSGSCYRCGRKGHWANKCYAKTDIDGDELDSDDDF